MAIQDTINRVFREFKRYTGDGQAGEPTGAPLPVGDPQSGPYSAKKSEIRAALLEVFEGAEETLADLDARYLGAMDEDPATDNEGEALITGALYFNTVEGKFRVWTGTVWQDQSTSLGDGDVTEPKHATGGVSTRALATGAASLAKIGDDAKADFRLVDPNGPRIPFRYYGPTACQIVGIRALAMGGMRCGGRYKVDRAPVFEMPAYLDGERNIIDWGNGTSTAGNLFAEAFHVKSNPYANFAAANDGDATATLGAMPYLRVGSIAGSVVTLNQAGENQRSIAGKTYQFTTNGLVGADVLVITETKDSRPNGFSYRVTTVTANTQTTVTLADVGSMGAYDYFLIAPPGYDHYCYLNTGYMDTAEIRNIADTGTFVGTRGAQNTQANLSGTITTPVEVPCDGHISPLATAVAFSHGDTHSTSSGGDCVIRYGMDNGNHDTHEFYYHKDGSASQAFTFMFSPVPFSFFPKIYFYSGGGLNGPTCTRAMNIRGWIEP